MPSLVVMLLVVAYPLGHAFRTSLERYDLRFPGSRSWVGLANYLDVLSSSLWWRDLGTTLLLTVTTVALELLLGLAIALVMHRTLAGRRVVRSAVLAPYALTTVVAALAWRFAFDPATGFINPLLGMERDWLGTHLSALTVIVAAEVWKTTPFMALLLLAGLTLVPEELLQAARIDGAGPLRRFRYVTLPMMRPALVAALLFRSLDAFRIFDSVFVLTRGSVGTETVSILGYRQLLVRLNLGIGSAVSILVFVCAALLALAFLKGLGAPVAAGGDR